VTKVHTCCTELYGCSYLTITSFRTSEHRKSHQVKSSNMQAN